MKPLGQMEVFLSTGVLAGLGFGLLSYLALDATKPQALFMGAFFGICFGAAILPFQKGVEATFAFSDRHIFAQALVARMAESGYELHKEHEGIYEFRPLSLLTLGLAGVSLSPTVLNRIFATLEDSKATLVGPRYAMKRIEARLRQIS